MDRRSTKSLWRDYAVPMQDPQAYSLNYYKDTSRDPRKGLLKKKPKTKKVDYTDQTGLLKIDEAPPKRDTGGVLYNRPCPNCGRRECQGCGPEMTPDKGKAPKNLKDRAKKIPVKNPNAIAGVPKKLLYTTEDGIKVFEVDDDYVKVNLYEDFTEGGNWEAYPEFVPEGEVWVASDKTPQNQEDIITHELTEVRLMQDKGMTYDKAHVIANRTEMNKRIQERPGLLVPMKKKGGKVGDPKNRNKPGGSNVGKYSKSEGPFAGPSGGAPAGSYPIGSKARGKSALKLAHNAPNPSGIKAAVYRKYPDLKAKKAMEGAKLGLMGMGEMQFKAASGPTKYNQPPDKVKGNFGLYKRKKEARKFNRPPYPH